MDRQKTFMVIDDHDEVVRLVKTILYMEGYTVIWGCSGENALYVNKMHPSPIDILLTDVRMENDRSGCDLARAMRVLRPEIKVIYMSAFAADERVAEEVEAGMAGFIAKPFTAKKLLAKVEEVLADRPQPQP